VVQDSPGFASSRLGLALGLEAMRDARARGRLAETSTRRWSWDYNHPMGPLKLTDLVGLDVRLAIAEYLHQRLSGAAVRAPAASCATKSPRGSWARRRERGLQLERLSGLPTSGVVMVAAGSGPAQILDLPSASRWRCVGGLRCSGLVVAIGRWTAKPVVG